MKRFLLLFLISNFGFCQDVERIKALDTIYISFTKKKDLEKHMYNNYRNYRFYFKKTEYLLFDKPDYKGLSESARSFLPIEVDKSFLKKHKKDIININFLKRFESQYIACELLTNHKTLYIVDFTEKKRKIILYKVYLIYNCPVYE